MSLENLLNQLKNQQSLPPVESWDPDYCGEIDLVIKSDGAWFYQGTPFKRMNMVKLFASVIKKEADEYFLVTPVEKIKIKVELYPFLITQWSWQDESKSQMLLSTNLDDTFILGQEHPLTIDHDGNLVVNVRRNLQALVHRNVYYQWVEEAQVSDDEKSLVLHSDDQTFVLGDL
ncbi:DUF1285 domain-containing protein [Thalassotalea sp. LPB0316]|uniref:DUF1285 domain-containing protein n=1 Tax=Thalassotalea sp. LPB0316 TaxID=2769490 RepID=UPI001869623E|nr:DUF1285 domain-containing protein [Thalassotalea sp. LPB0316]QOL26177.1 DUF1285 domain-containing protein [Thalassotalea sp. LPB0316]